MDEPKTGTELMMRNGFAVTRAHAAARRQGCKGPEVDAFANGAMWAYEEITKHFILSPKEPFTST